MDDGKQTAPLSALAWLGGLARPYAGRLGLALGALLLTGGVGPWLPFQMLGAGWVATRARAAPNNELELTNGPCGGQACGAA